LCTSSEATHAPARFHYASWQFGGVAALSAETETREVQVAARARGVRLLIVNASRLSEIETAFADLVQQRADALLVSADGFLFTYADQIVALAGRHAVPAIYSIRRYTAAGGVMSY